MFILIFSSDLIQETFLPQHISTTRHLDHLDHHEDRHLRDQLRQLPGPVLRSSGGPVPGGDGGVEPHQDLPQVPTPHLARQDDPLPGLLCPPPRRV